MTAHKLEMTGATARVILAFALVVGLLASFVAEAGAATQQLPNLVADPPNNVSLETSLTEGGLKEPGEAKLLLRFNGYIHNTGPGAVDFRGSRKTATEPMHAFQRVFNNEGGFSEEPSPAELVYAKADGHEHFHLQRAARYSLWNSSKIAEAAPAMKVGFCLDDSEHVEPSVGPSQAVYSDATGRKFCRQHEPEALTLFEGISAGWRDRYESSLAFQWVEASNVLPGKYWLREDVNPLGVIKEVGGVKAPGYATSPTIISGFNAEGQSLSTRQEEPVTISLTQNAWNDSHTPSYSIVSQPAHGKLSAISGNKLSYTPAAGFIGTDSFTFSASDPSSQFPRHPAIATVLIQVGAASHAGGSTLLVGDPTSNYSVLDETPQGHEEAFQFIAQTTGTVEELEFRTGATSSTGVERVALAVFADNEGSPGAMLGSAAFSGNPPPSAWIKASGLSTPVVANTKYWLVVLPVGRPGAQFYFNAAFNRNSGMPNVESKEGALTAAMPEAAWEPYNQGPVGFEAFGSPPALAISGAQEEMFTGTSVPLTANVSNDSGGVTWEASSGSVTAEGPGGPKALYVAPASPGTVTVTARLTDDPSVSGQVTIKVAFPPAPTPAPSVSSSVEQPPGSGSGGNAGFKTSNPVPGLSRPRAMLMGRKLIMTTTSTVPGRVRLSAYLRNRRIGTCVSQTPGGLSFTCRITLGPKISLHAHIKIVASLRVGEVIINSGVPAERIPKMTMTPTTGLNAHAAFATATFWCSPSMLPTPLNSSN